MDRIAIAAAAYRAACAGHDGPLYGRHFDARVDWGRQAVALTGEQGTSYVDFRDPAFMAAAGISGA